MNVLSNVDLDRSNIRMLFCDPWYQMIARLTETIVNGSYDFFCMKKFSPALMPVTTGTVSSPMGLGSDSSPVKISLFDQETYLADSMQFQLEYMTRFSQHGAWYIMPTFRGEDPDERHLNQFFHIEAEMHGDLDDVMDLVEEFIFFLSRKIAEKHEGQLRSLIGDMSHFDALFRLSQIPRMSFAEFEKKYGHRDAYFSRLGNGTRTISREGELALLNLMGGVAWITHLPHLTVPFYQAKESTSEYALCADFLMGIGEIVGCGQRHSSYLEVMEALHKHSVEAQEYAWYLAMKKDFPLQTAGFGLGLERLLLWVLRHKDIRDIPLFQRLKGKMIYP